MRMKVKGTVTATLFVMALLFACPTQADSTDDSLWQSAAGQLPTHGWFGWEMIRGGTPTPTMVLSNGVLVLNSSYANNNAPWQFFQQRDALLAFTTNLVIEARLRYVSGSSTDPKYTPCEIHWAYGNGVGNAFGVHAGQIFLLTVGNGVGPTAAVDTTSAPHTYRIETVGTAANGLVSVYQDGVLVLTGSNYYDTVRHGTAKNIYWGDGTGSGYGISEWHSVRHNALTPIPVREGQVLFGYIDKNRVALNLATGKASFLGPDTNVPAAPNNFVLHLTRQPKTGLLYGLIHPDTGARLLRLNPFTGESSIVGYIQNSGNSILGAEGLAFNPVSGQLYASVRTTSGSYSPHIALVNPDTGEATIISTVNSTPQKDIDDIGFVGDTMYVMDAVTTSNPQNSHLYTVDPQTGQTTFVGTTGKINSGLAYNEVDGYFYSSHHGSRELLRISPVTAATTVVGTTHSISESGSLLYAVAFASPAGQTQMQIALESGNAVLDWPAFQGFYYQLFSSTNLTSWSTEGVPTVTNGCLLSKSLPMGPEPTKFYRVEVVTP